MLDIYTGGFRLHLQGIYLQLRFIGIAGRKRAHVIMLSKRVQLLASTKRPYTLIIPLHLFCYCFRALLNFP